MPTHAKGRSPNPSVPGRDGSGLRAAIGPPVALSSTWCQQFVGAGCCTSTGFTRPLIQAPPAGQSGVLDSALGDGGQQCRVCWASAQTGSSVNILMGGHARGWRRACSSTREKKTRQKFTVGAKSLRAEAKCLLHRIRKQWTEYVYSQKSGEPEEWLTTQKALLC